MKNIALIFLCLALCVPIFSETLVFMVYGQDFMVGIPLPYDWAVDGAVESVNKSPILTIQYKVLLCNIMKTN